jgi:outer membrane protein OmpA-like peptidoglycan-associated protein
LGLATTLFPLSGNAQDFRLHGAAGLAHAVGGFQQREFGFGGTARAAFELVLLREIGVYGQASGTWLGAGDLPLNSTLAPLDAAASYAGTGGLHLRPFARHTGGKTFSLAGLWLGGGGGMAYTGGVNRPLVDAGLGLDLLFSKAKVGLGPMVGWEHVFQPNTELRPEDANILFVGVHGMLEIGLKPESIDGDRDADGIRDSLDKCPNEPEDKDGFADEDGCPDKDNDEDAVVDVYDNCPNVAEDRDGFRDNDGCPEADNDEDGILDVSDKCPNEPEDKDKFEDSDGCPDKDNDQDGIPDREDLCPNEPETKNGYADDDGCPDAEQIRVVGDKIVLDDRVHFMVNSHIIRGISYPLLERLARLINQHPEYISIDVQGHTDERGPDWYNEKLSQDRANAVLEFLVSRGVKRNRLSAHGFGKSKPLVEKNSEYAWYMNRRVEFEITRENKERTFTTLNGEPPKDDKSAAAPESTPTPAVQADKPPDSGSAAPKKDSKAKSKTKKSESATKPSDDPELRALPMNEEHPESEDTP